jgi:tetratricopeptide (TPR) repeat protein
MVIRRTQPRYPRRGPSCLLVLIVGAAFLMGAYVVTNAEEVREVLTIESTPEPTRSATSYAASAALLERDNEFPEAIQAYTAAILLDATKVEFYVPLVNLLIVTRRPAEALEWAEKAVLLAPDDARVWVALAAAQIAHGQRLWSTGHPTDAVLAYADAERAARRATNLNPENAVAWANLAGALVRQGPERNNEAQEAIEIAILLGPESYIVHQNRALVLERQGYYRAAIDAYFTAIELNPTVVDLYIGLAYNYYAADNRPHAINTFRDALNIDPDSADAYDGLGWMYFQIGEYPRAEENLLKAVELDPEMVRGRAHLGAAYYRNQNNYISAIPQLEYAVERYQKVGWDNAMFFNMLGLAYYFTDERQCPQANELFQRVLATLPNDTNAQEGLRLCRSASLEQAP